jgi:hypothetical protein
MKQYFLSTRWFFLAAALLVASLSVTGCGGDSSANADEVAVTTGSLPKTEFVKRADALCVAAKTQFTREYTAFLEANEALLTGSKAEQSTAMEKIVDKMLVPNFERAVDGISSLGAPKADAQEVSAFLNALQQRLGELEETPSEISKATYPLAKAAKLAKAYGLTGCAESFG